MHKNFHNAAIWIVAPIRTRRIRRIRAPATTRRIGRDVEKRKEKAVACRGVREACRRTDGFGRKASGM